MRKMPTMMRSPRKGRVTASAIAEEEIFPGDGAETEIANDHPQRALRQPLLCKEPRFGWEAAQAHPTHLHQLSGETSSLDWQVSLLFSVTPALDNPGMTLK